MKILTGSVLKHHLHVGVKKNGLLGKICIEMLKEARACTTANSGVVTNQSVAHRLISALRYTFNALDYVGCEVNQNDHSDFERMDLNILLSKTDTTCVDQAKWLQNHYINAFVGNEKYKVRLMAIHNDFKHSAPSEAHLRVHNGDFFYLVGDVRIGVADVEDYILRSNDFARYYFGKMGFKL